MDRNGFQMRMSRRFWNCIRLRVFLTCSAMALCGTVIAQSGGGYFMVTVAGNGSGGFGGDGGPATSAQLSGPAGVATDATGNLFVADWSNCRIRKVASSGIITTVAGTGACGFGGDGRLATAAYLHSPGGVAVDAVGNLFVADTYNNRIREVSAVISSRKGGGHLDRSQVLRIVQQAARRARIRRKVSPHWFRHAHASHAMDRGAPIHVVIYVHPFQDGNGRMHRCLIHHVLAERKFTPPGMVFPVSSNQANHNRTCM